MKLERLHKPYIDHPWEVIKIIFFLLSLFIVVPQMGEPLVLPKLITGTFISIVATTVTLIYAVYKKKLIIRFSWFTLSILVFTCISVMSSLLTEGNVTEAIKTQFGILTFVPFLLLILSIQHFFTKKDIRVIEGSFVVFSIIYSIQGILKQLNPENPPAILTLPLLNSWINLVIIAVISISILIRLLIHNRNITPTQYAIHVITAIGSIAILSFGLIAGIRMSGQDYFALRQPFLSQFIIMSNALSNPRYALLGVSPERYIDVSSKFRPQQLNESNIWQARIALSSFLPFHITTTLGLSGLLGIILLSGSIALVCIRSTSNMKRLTLLCATVGVLLHPPNHSLFIMLGIFTVLYESNYLHININISKNIIRLLFLAIAGMIISFLIFCSFILFRLIQGELYIGNVNTAVQQNNGQEAYKQALKAMEVNHYDSTYRRILSDIQSSIAFNVLTEISTSSGTLKAENEALFQQLIAQSIIDANAAIVLHDTIINWENKNNLYTNLIGIAQNADTFALSTMEEVLKRDPNNPSVYLRYGQILHALGQTQKAESAYIVAAKKRDLYLEPWIGLTQLYTQTNQMQKAQSANATVQSIELRLNPSRITEQQIIPTIVLPQSTSPSDVIQQ